MVEMSSSGMRKPKNHSRRDFVQACALSTAGFALRPVLPTIHREDSIGWGPFFVELELDGRNHPDLRIDGYVGENLALSRLFSSDPADDRLSLKLDDSELLADGVDATRLVCKIVDRFGADRAHGKGLVRFKISGPGDIIGDNPLNLTETGGAAAIWVQSRNSVPGVIRIVATHPTLSSVDVEIRTAREVDGFHPRP